MDNDLRKIRGYHIEEEEEEDRNKWRNIVNEAKKKSLDFEES